MVLVFMVLKCFSCETFQVHQVKKSSNKWSCKICNEKQSVQKVYGQGTAADCRKHVQKLNMMRGEKNKAEQQMWNHPPEDYGDTFDTSEQEHTCHDSGPEHPVLLTEKGSKWKMYIEPQDSHSDEEVDVTPGMYTTDRAEFDQTRKKKRKDLKRSGSDPSKPSKPHPHSKHSHEDIHQKFTSSSASSLPHSHAAIHPYSSGSHSHTCTHPYSSSGSHSHTSIHPYSVVSDEMDELLSGSKSLSYLHTTHDRYNRLDDGLDSASSLHPLCSSTSESISSQTHDQTSEPFHQNTPKVKHNQQLWNPPQNEQRTEQLWDPPTENLQQHSHMTHEDRMTIIREDISRFRKSSNVTGSGSSSATTAAAVGSIPAVSSRWSKFMTESEEGEEEEEEEGEGDSVQTHMLHSRVAVARYN